MESSLGGKTHNVYGPLMTDMKAAGKRTLEWDLNDWKWDGDLFAASRLNPLLPECRSRPLFPVQPEVPLNTNFSNGSSDCSGDINQINGSANRESEKRRRVIVVQEEGSTDEAGSLNLKLGGQVYPIAEDEVDKCGKKTKIAGTSSNHPVCQVEGCDTDLSNAKDYHRRHKVCEVHSKATSAVVGNLLQRFCQQCSRFHVLHEFDEGKRSCRRRLAGHNRRRRKQPDPAVNVGSPNDEHNSSYLLICLLRILTNLHSNGSDQSKDQDLLSHFLRNLANLAGSHNGSNISRLLQGSPDLPNAGASAGAAEKDTPTSLQQCKNAVALLAPQGLMMNANQQQRQQVPSAGQSSAQFTRDLGQLNENAVGTAEKKHKLNNIDLNNVCDESQDYVGNVEQPHASLNTIPGPQQDSQKSSPPHTSGNSGSSGHSLSSSSGSHSQGRTDRIIFKLFGKDPNDLPHLLRTQILEWLSHSPTDIEGYIRPGCIILTLYLRLEKSPWEELCGDLNSSLSRLLNLSDHSFWRTGWIYSRVQHRAAFIFDGHVVLDTPLPSKGYNNCSILSISPIAVPACERAQFTIKSSNLSPSTSRLQCAFEGKYLVQESCSNLEYDETSEHEDILQLHFSCSMPNVCGRGFIEVEDYGLSGSFFPFIVSEPDVCSEICTLERIMEVVEISDGITGGDEKLAARNEALDFIHEMGWLLHRSCLKYRVRDVETSVALFPFERLKWLLDYSVDHDWCAVLKKVLDIAFDGCVDAGSCQSVKEAVCETGLLHTAVRRKNKSMVESLLIYLPGKVAYNSDHKLLEYGQFDSFVFRPDVAIGGLTPLHMAASGDGFEDVLDALLEDPGGVGLEAWRSVRCSTGLTPNDYASLRGKYSYIDLVKKKISKKALATHVVVDIPDATSTKQTDGLKLAKISSMETEKTTNATPALRPCGMCDRKPGYGYVGTAVAYRPAMLSLLAIAAVCVCVALLFKSEPEVYMFKPFRWNELKFGAM